MRYIDQEKIYEATDAGLIIFQHYFPGDDLRNPKTYFKIRESEKSASARLAWYQGYWRITDFGNQDQVNGMRAIDFVVWREQLPYYDSLLYIEQCIINRKVEGKDFVRSKWSAEYDMREMTPDDKKGDYNFSFKETITEKELSSIGRYVTKDILDHFNCKPILQYEYCGPSKKLNRDVVHIFKATDDYPMFLFDYGDFKKLYKPHDQEKKNRFLYVGKKPKEYVYGLKQLEKAKSEFTDDDENGGVVAPEEKPEARVVDLFRCSGESDALNLAALGFHVYWLNSESADLDYPTFKMLDLMCENHYQVMDLDTTGQEQAMKNALKHISLYTIELPTWLKFKRDFRGNPCKDLKDFINLSGDDFDATRYDFMVLKNNAKKVKFWWKSKDKKSQQVNYNIDMQDYYFFLRANGFHQMDSIYHKRAGYCYVRITGKVVELISPDDFKRIAKRFTMEWVESRKLMDIKKILNKIIGSNQLSEEQLATIRRVTLDFRNHSSDTEYLNFNNGSVRIRKDKIDKIPHSDLPNFILGKLIVNNTPITHLIDRDIRVNEHPAIEVNATPAFKILLDKLANEKDEEKILEINNQIAAIPEIEKYELKINDPDFIYVKFLQDISAIHWRKATEEKNEKGEKQKLTDIEIKEQNLCLINQMFFLGYHASQYKDRGKPWVTFLQDAKISEIGQASGRSGKSLLQMAPTFCRASFYIGGRSLNLEKAFEFIYDGYTEFHDYIQVDDLHEYALFNNFYTEITGNRKINPKNYAATTLEYPDSGKMSFSSNFELQNVDASTIGRIVYCMVSDYYHEKTKYNDYRETRSPLTKFARRLYDDFTDEEWVKFYNFMAYCVQLQMRFYKIQPPAGNIEKRQLRRIMSQGLGRDEEFLKWANDYFINRPAGYTSDFSPIENGYFNTYVIKKNAFDNFTDTLTQKQKHDYKAAKFKKHLDAWCEYNDYELNPESVCTDLTNRRIMKTIDNETRELIYISSNRPVKKSDPAGPPPAPLEYDDKPPF
jgi:hypothetical protein